MFTLNLKLTGLTCDACVKLIRKRLSRIADIADVHLDLTGSLSIEAARNISKSEIEAVLAGMPYSIA